MNAINRLLVVILTVCGPLVRAQVPVELQHMEALWRTMAIRINAPESAHHVSTDNVAGYYEHYTHRRNAGVGYRFRDSSVLADVLVGDGLRWWDREQHAEYSDLLPYGRRTHFAFGDDTLMVFSGQSTLAIQINSQHDAQQTVALASLFNNQFDVEQHGELWLLRARNVLDGVPRVAAVVASAAFVWRDNDLPTQCLNVCRGAFHRVGNGRRFTLFITFADNVERALAQAKSIDPRQAWQQQLQQRYQQLTRSFLWTNNQDYNRALLWARASAQSFVVQEFGAGIWAGLPWFRDNWGRDTFIALAGTSLVNGEFAQARAIIEQFWRWQNLDVMSRDYGRVPNRVAAQQAMIYNTVDGTPWLIRALDDYARYSGDRLFVSQQLPAIDRYIAGVEQHWLDENGLLMHDDADTWMDARIDGQQAWSPRGNRAIEIQALWFTTLHIAADLHERAGNSERAQTLRVRADRVKTAIAKLFVTEDGIADRLRHDGSADTTLRPNQLMAITIPTTSLLAPEVAWRSVQQVTQHLLLPYGVLSLDPQHSAFHPRHQNDGFHHKDAAYHNGTIWGWNAGFTISALVRFNQQETAWSLTKNLSDQILRQGSRGTMSELLDATLAADGQVTPSGTYAQSWSVAEFSRNAFQDFLGVVPDVPDAQLRITSALPQAWSQVFARIPFGPTVVDIAIRQQQATQEWQFSSTYDKPLTVLFFWFNKRGEKCAAQFELRPGKTSLKRSAGSLRINGKRFPVRIVEQLPEAALTPLPFASAVRYHEKNTPTLQGKHVLQQRIARGERVF